jgi:hypothetical protein
MTDQIFSNSDKNANFSIIVEKIRFKLSTDTETTCSFNNFLTMRQYIIKSFQVISNEIEFTVQKSNNQHNHQIEFKIINSDYDKPFINSCNLVEINKEYYIKCRLDMYDDIAIELCIKNCLPSGDNWYIIKN